ncbi:MAG: exodeoxyribonuclease VII small subunit [Brachymonas sp.]|nr:exodeoxyribonuclease VII small subunit [Brachymonas sp.]MBP6138939.1 exodeoxyribonuclease VII small subunit [Brachymonas sp.]MBP6966534.1 exodeoxyribonuclease VII small subunit [Brachymonas sp.]MBP7246446.1 exodeoxyribonuclease VII small subunit [Brachymonas sp.]MBP8746288.1 exodeoxyribonuclease VII small subunit [Brachymonas sp.]
MTKAKSTTSKALPATYEAALAELEALVQKLESGQIPLDDLLAGYQRGAALLGLCKDKLAAVENQINLLDDSAQGNNTKLWDDSAV